MLRELSEDEFIAGDKTASQKKEMWNKPENTPACFFETIVEVTNLICFILPGQRAALKYSDFKLNCVEHF